MECYVFETGLGQPALDEINNDPTFPIVGRNAGTGELEPNKQMTTCWCDEIRIRETDGKEYFPRLPEARLAEIDPARAQQWFDTFNPTIEVFDKSWVPEPTELT